MSKVCTVLVSHMDKTIRCRGTLDLRNKKPASIKLLTPKFSEKYFADKKLQAKVDSPQKQLVELKRKHKQESRGALRELRKDTRFLANLKLQQQQEEDAERERKRNKIMATLESEQHEKKALMKKRKNKSAF